MKTLEEAMAHAAHAKSIDACGDSGRALTILRDYILSSPQAVTDAQIGIIAHSNISTEYFGDVQLCAELFQFARALLSAQPAATVTDYGTKAQPAAETPSLPDPLGCNACKHHDCARFNGPRSVECRAMADNACARMDWAQPQEAKAVVGDLFVIADVHALASSEDGNRTFDRGGLAQFAADILAAAPQVEAKAIAGEIDPLPWKSDEDAIGNVYITAANGLRVATLPNTSRASANTALIMRAIAFQAAAPQALGKAIHYPECWDTAAYPTIEDALNEMFACFKCSDADCPSPQEKSPVDSREKHKTTLQKFAAVMKAQPGRIDIGGNSDEFIAAEFPREYFGFQLALSKQQEQAPVDKPTIRNELTDAFEALDSHFKEQAQTVTCQLYGHQVQGCFECNNNGPQEQATADKDAAAFVTLLSRARNDGLEDAAKLIESLIGIEGYGPHSYVHQIRAMKSQSQQVKP